MSYRYSILLFFITYCKTILVTINNYKYNNAIYIKIVSIILICFIYKSAGFLYLCMKLNYLEVRRNKIKIIEDLKEKDRNKNTKKNNISIKNKFFGLFGKPTGEDFSRSTPNLSFTPQIDHSEDKIIPMHPHISRSNTLKTFTDMRKQSFINMKHSNSISSTSKIPDIKEIENQCSEMELLNSENAIGNFNRVNLIY